MKIKNKELSKIDDNSLLYFAKKDSLSDIEKHGLRSEFTNNKIAQATTYKSTLFKGELGLLNMIDAWLEDIIYTIGLDKYFSSVSSFKAVEYAEIKDNYNKLYREGKIYNSELTNEAFAYLSNLLTLDVILEIENNDSNITKGFNENYELYKIYGHNKEKMYNALGYITNGIISSDEVNILVNNNDVDALNLVREIYNNYQNNGFEYVDEFIYYIDNLKEQKKLRRNK